MKNIVILTGSELRHAFFRKFVGLADNIQIINSYCEVPEQDFRSTLGNSNDNSLQNRHLANRDQSEKDFFELFVDNTPDHTNPVFLPKGEVNSSHFTDTIIQSEPDFLIAYGCSIIREPLLSTFSGRFLNVHLGLSPYYRGSGTNYWPLVNNEPEYVGATFMYTDAGIDTGEIIHQIRARIVPGDTPSTIGNRLILDMAYIYTEIISRFESLKEMRQPVKPTKERVYRQKDFSEESVITLYKNFENGLVYKYLSSQVERCNSLPIIHNPALQNLAPA